MQEDVIIHAISYFNCVTPLFRLPVKDWDRGLGDQGSGIQGWGFGIGRKSKQQSKHKNRATSNKEQGTSKSWDIFESKFGPPAFCDAGESSDWTDWTVYSHTAVTSSTRGRRIIIIHTHAHGHAHTRTHTHTHHPSVLLTAFTLICKARFFVRRSLKPSHSSILLACCAMCRTRMK